ncbi:MAG TPA: PA domain-containing protein, partial [Gemmataceae bacterium]|nr:PA domain-containing protein [Gemmataceae bacterium]
MQLRQWRTWSTAALFGLTAVLIGTRTTAEELKGSAAAVAASEARLKRDVTFLASDECEGRGPVTKGLVLAGDYIANEFKKAGLKPGGVDGTYFQSFAVAGAKLDAPARFVLKSPSGVVMALHSGGDFNPLGISGSGKADAGIVFAGYGITGDIKVPKPPKPKDDSAMGDQKPEEKEEKYLYDDYASLDVAGKIVVVLRDAPRSANHNALDRMWKQRNGALARKIENADKHGVAAIVFVNDAGTAADGDDLMDFNFQAMASSSAKIPAFTIHRSLLQSMLASRGEA